jgi:hypothetical protein
MASKLSRYVLRPIANFFRVAEYLTEKCTRKLREQLLGTITDDFVTLLLKGMDWFFALTPDARFRRNLQDFNGRYFFKTANDTVKVSATFNNGNMRVHKDAIEDWDVKVTFKNGKAFRDFILSEKQDIIDWLSRNEVEVDGNLNHIFKFAFMARAIVGKLEQAFG